MGLILITHDLGVVADVADRIAVMYAGRIVETAPVARHLRAPRPPVHARACSTPSRAWTRRAGSCYAIKGLPPEPAAHPAGLRLPPALPAGPGRSARTDGAARAVRASARTARAACHFAGASVYDRRDADSRRSPAATPILRGARPGQALPAHPGHRVPQADRRGQGRRRRRPRPLPRRDPRHRRRVRLRQVDAWPSC